MQIANWATMAALSLPVYEIDTFTSTITAEQYSDESLDYRLAELVLEFFIDGCWQSRINPDESAALHIRLRVAAAYLAEVHQYQKADRLALWRACLFLADLVGMAWKSGLIIWFAEKASRRDIPGALPACFDGVMQEDGTILKTLCRKYPNFHQIVESRRGVNEVDEAKRAVPVSLPGYVHAWLKEYARKNNISEDKAVLLLMMQADK